VIERRIKCDDERYCDTLGKRIGAQSDRGYGFAVGLLVHPGVRKLHTTPVFYRVPKKLCRRDVLDAGDGMHPLYLNFCPFCGYDFQSKVSAFMKMLEDERKDVA
jgi:hypothetical protein